MAVENVSTLLLHWYDRHARNLPWRIAPGSNRQANPYAIWMSEIMLQQTMVAAVIPYFNQFQLRWPTVQSLASADDADVMAAWAGLGYYSRARNLLACARTITEQFGGLFPDDEKTLLKLPGIGPYTAAAIAAIAFQKPATVVDGNVERVVARLFNVDEPLPRVGPRLRELAAKLTPPIRPGDYAQAMMDLGATICTPRQPQCLLCPLASQCQGLAAGRAALLPVKTPKAPRPERYGRIFWIEHDAHVLLVRRPSKGLLGGMRALPTSDWAEHRPSEKQLPSHNIWEISDHAVRHIFTHFALNLDIARAIPPIPAAAILNSVEAGEWWPIAKVDEAGLPTVFKKAADFAKNWISAPNQSNIIVPERFSLQGTL